MNIVEAANKYIPPAKNTKVLKYKAGETRDIVREVVATYNDSKNSLQLFAPHLKADTVLQTCNNIWSFWKTNITYQVDPDGIQWAKTPAAVWATKFCDCKSFSIAIGATLHALGINFKFRFTSYNGNTTVPTHVYIIALVAGKEIIIDCVWTHFNKQKAFTKNWDYMSTEIFRIEGLEMETVSTGVYGIGELNIDVNDSNLSQAQLDIAISKQGLEIEQQLVRRKGIGALNSAMDNSYQIEIEAHNAVMGLLDTNGIAGAKRRKRIMKRSIDNNYGKGASPRQQKKLQKAGITVKNRRAGLLKRIGKGIKKGLTAPLRALLKKELPASAPFFLYLFINANNKKLMANLPEVVAMKRTKALKYKNVIVDKFQMKESNFNSIIRNGIMKQFGKTPEYVIAQFIKDNNFKVGAVPVLAAKIALKAALKVGKKLAMQAIKKILLKAGLNMKADIEQFTPVSKDWSGGLTDAQKAEMAKDVEDAPNNNDVEAGKGKIQPLDEDGTKYAVKDSKSTRPSGGGGSSAPDADSAPAPAETEKQAAQPETFKDSETGADLGKEAPAPASGGGSSTMLLVGVAAVAAIALASGKRRK